MGQPEIWEYQKSVVNKNGLRAHLQLNSMLVGGAWDEAQQGYELQFERTAQDGSGTGVVETVFADILIAATGGSWSVPRLPTDKELPGMDDFKGEIFHTANYRKDVDLSGKRVGVVGNAASGCQIVPVIAEDPTTHVINFGRSSQWFIHRVSCQPQARSQF